MLVMPREQNQPPNSPNSVYLEGEFLGESI